MARTWRVVVGSDDAGYEYKEALKADLEKDPRVARGRRCGRRRGRPHRRIPRVAIAAAEKDPRR